MRRLFLLLTLIACLLLVVACSGDDDAGSTPEPTAGPSPAEDHTANPLKIVVSLQIFADFAREVVGDQGQVTALIPPGANPHTYVPTDDQIPIVEEAQFIFYNGNGLETPTQQFIEAHQPHPVFLLNFSHNIPSPSTEQPVDGPIYAEQVGDDPHLFLDPRLATIYPESIADSLTIHDPLNSPYYHARFQDFKRRVDEMAADIPEKLSAIPDDNKGLIVLNHNSVIHFANKYGLGVVGTADMGEDALTDVMTDKKAPAVFAETGYDNSVLEQVAQDVGVEVCHLETDSIADEATTYIEMMERNMDELVRCLS